jgi:hypothetical protein
MELKNFFLSDNMITSLKKWINNDFKNICLFIYGSNGIGKTLLSNILLKDYKIIRIDINFYKTNKNLEEYLDLTLGKKNISMMFERTNIYKALVFDDLNLLFNDKILFNNIFKWYKKNKTKYTSNPIIFISNNSILQNKNVIHLSKKSIKINLNYNTEQLFLITKKLLNDFKVDDTEIYKLISKSNKNINNIISNLKFLKNGYDLNIVSKKDFSKDIIDVTHNILKMDFNIENLYLNSSDSYIISLNILDNINKLCKKQDIIKIYKNNILASKYKYNVIKNNNYDLDNYMFLHSIIYPIYYIKQNNNKLFNLNYNRYISKSLIYISNEKCNYDFYVISYIFNMIKNEKDYTELILKYNYHNLLQKFIKYYNYFNNDNILKTDLLQI